MSPGIESRELFLLDPDFRSAISELTKILARKYRIGILLSTTVRGPLKQAEAWCRSRTPTEIVNAATMLRASGAPKLASLLSEDWSLTRPFITKYLPGNSWHQWGMAVDYCIEVGELGIADWDSSTHNIVAKVAKAVGVTHGSTLHRNRRKWHIQAKCEESPQFCPNLVSGWLDIEAHMSERFLL